MIITLFVISFLFLLYVAFTIDDSKVLAQEVAEKKDTAENYTKKGKNFLINGEYDNALALYSEGLLLSSSYHVC